MANAPVDPSSGPTTSTGRLPRLPRWTRQEILVLIDGKRMVERRGRGRVGPGLAQPGPVEPKWAAVSAYCKRHGVNRGPVQCRKRWSNLAGDYKKIKEWERGDKNESFWGMRNDLRREKRLPGFFDREVYDILDGVDGVGGSKLEMEEEEEEKEKDIDLEEEIGKKGEGVHERVSDSGKKDGLFEDEEEEVEEREGEKVDVTVAAPLAYAVPISEKSYEPMQPGSSEPGTSKEKQPSDDQETDLPSREGHKRRRTGEDERDETNVQMQLLQVLERNSRMVAAQLEAQNINLQLDRDQRQEQTNGLLGVLNKLADSLSKIADKM
ncbi:heterogeneous nuclear ribonucleoprotein U-like protein 2 [Carex littledalei]|uniref:Heterogeneous nuclear ribonucleoprotein U-like protein 2 n=1 Tax=Carex littledalei TaxID=544730 RepID=A0A833QK31_9POAL|nr:heterogeneous nuclear ribonucleoprotein U-like protein 2 [Carex littledalei]